MSHVFHELYYHFVRGRLSDILERLEEEGKAEAGQRKPLERG
jgi:hypothetical protein